MVEQSLNIGEHPIMGDERLHCWVFKGRERRFNHALNCESSPSYNGDEVVASFGIVFEDFCFTAVCSGSIPVIRWFKWIVQYESKISTIEDTIIQHLSIPWFKNTKFLNFSWHEHHW
jgi:hypothetical protein